MLLDKLLADENNRVLQFLLYKNDESIFLNGNGSFNF